MFARPIKADLDRVLSNMMHGARHRLMMETNRLLAEASTAGADKRKGVIGRIASVADELHEVAMQRTIPMLADFVRLSEVPPAEVTSWARPQLEELGESLLGVIPPNGYPADHQRVVAEYHTVFQQRLDGVLRDVEIGSVEGAGFARTDQVESKDEWISAAAALQLLKPSLGEYDAQKTICTRAHGGLIRSRAKRLMFNDATHDDKAIPKDFWWADGGSALNQNWKTGDFDTWIGRTDKVHVRAFGVSFLRSDIENMVPPIASSLPAAQPGGRTRADWWEDLLIDVCFQHFRGDLQPKKQADVERAMQQWMTEHGCDAAESTVRERARKLWRAIQRESEAGN